MSTSATAKTVLVTGSAQGIGRATVEHFAKEGWNVVASMRSPEKETELQALGSVLVVKLDVTKPETIAPAVDAAVAKFGGIDVLVNNAGWVKAGTAEEELAADKKAMFDINVFGLMAVTNAVTPVMRKAKSGVILNVTSTIGHIAFPLMSTYAATKYAVSGWTESISYELASVGVTAKIVAPGGTKTGLADSVTISTKVADYQGIVDGMNGMMAQSMSPDAISSPSLTAEVIFTAATDNTQQLLYPAGADSTMYTQQRSAAGLEAFVGGMKKNFGLAKEE